MGKGGNGGKGKPSFKDIIAAAQQDTMRHVHPLVKFSFKYLTPDNAKFDYNQYNAPYFLEFLERLKSISLMNMSEMLANRSPSLRCHPIKWSDTTESSFSIPNEEELVSRPYQFALSANEYGRIHGFIIDTQFYVVWLDKDHNLYA